MLKQLLSKTLDKHFEVFPGAKYMRKDHLQHVKLGYVSHEAGGMRGFMFMTNEMVCWLENDSRISIPVSTSLYEDIPCSIVEVYVHLDTSTVKIHDVLLYNRTVVTSRGYLERIELIRKWLNAVGQCVDTKPILHSAYTKHRIHNSGWTIDCVDFVDNISHNRTLVFKRLFCKYGATDSTLYWVPNIADHILFKFLVKNGIHYKCVKKTSDMFRQEMGDKTLFVKSGNGRNIPISYVMYVDGMVDGPGIFKWKCGHWEFVSKCSDYDTLQSFTERTNTIISHPVQKSKHWS